MNCDESDEDNEAIFNLLINRRPRVFRERKNFFNFYDDADFRCRFRLSKRAAWTIFEIIRDKIAHKTTKYKHISYFLVQITYFAISEIEQPLLSICFC